MTPEITFFLANNWNVEEENSIQVVEFVYIEVARDRLLPSGVENLVLNLVSF